MASGSRKKPAARPSAKRTAFRSDALATALERQDMAAVALALRNGNTVVPLVKPGPRDNPLDAGEVWTYRSPETGEIALLLFSDAANKPANLPPAVGLQSPSWLRAFLGANAEIISTVFFDIAGPHPMQASPTDLLAALDA
ncbi:dehydrogenase [Rathayibacter sp. YIM 133350]|uniref:dehydrogenase n=1 Tax=Rathayibacter sp. YIM 133350 TaxID=3131992 RepID=UPI00307D58DA